MRSDFYGLPYAAQQAIRKGERETGIARRRGFELADQEKRIAELEAELSAFRAREEQLVKAATFVRDHLEADTFAGDVPDEALGLIRTALSGNDPDSSTDEGKS